MENVAYITALIMAVGTVFAAIYQAKGTTEKTLIAHIEKLEKKIQQLEDDDAKKEERILDLQSKYDDLLKMYQFEKDRNDKLERRIKPGNRTGRKAAK